MWYWPIVRSRSNQNQKSGRRRNVQSGRLTLAPCSIQDAREYVRQFHRHHRPPLSGLFAVACAEGERVCGVAIVGRPVARMNQDGYTAEVTRLATDGTKNACSMLYAAAWRAARALGYRKLITYILASEKGTSLAASGWREIAKVKGRTWDCPTRPRVDRHPTQDKIRFEVCA
jgi:hypothetical protein